jgi:hypothetical protein
MDPGHTVYVATRSCLYLPDLEKLPNSSNIAKQPKSQYYPII